MTKEEAKRFGLQLLHGIMERNESYPVYANNVKQAIEALSEPNGSSEIPNNLEDAADNYISPIENEQGLSFIGFSGQDIKDAFIAGAEWQKEQMMKEVMEADVNIYRDLAEGESWAEFVVAKPTKNLGDKVRIIVIKAEEG